MRILHLPSFIACTALLVGCATLGVAPIVPHDIIRTEPGHVPADPLHRIVACYVDANHLDPYGICSGVHVAYTAAITHCIATIQRDISYITETLGRDYVSSNGVVAAHANAGVAEHECGIRFTHGNAGIDMRTMTIETLLYDDERAIIEATWHISADDTTGELEWGRFFLRKEAGAWVIEGAVDKHEAHLPL